MPRVLILRTFSHNRIWEGEEPYCHYEDRARDTILAWEPNLLNYTFNDIQFAVGLYSERYFTYIDPSNRLSFSGTPEEEHPSLLELRPINSDSNSFVIDMNGEIRIAFILRQKFFDITREAMIAVDEQFVNLKRAEPGFTSGQGRASSLCFTIDFPLTSLTNQLPINR